MPTDVSSPLCLTEARWRPILSFQTYSMTRGHRRSPTGEIRRPPVRRHADGWCHLEKTMVVRRVKDRRQDDQRWSKEHTMSFKHREGGIVCTWLCTLLCTCVLALLLKPVLAPS